MADEALSEYEVMRRRRIADNRQMLASLALPPNLLRVSSRSHAPKAAVKLEPTRRHKNQQLQGIKPPTKRAKKTNPNLEDGQKFERFQQSKQRNVKIQGTKRQQQQVIETRKRPTKQRKQSEWPPEKVAQRNADIQKFIQEELNKQACLAREQKQWELEHQRSRQEGSSKQDDVQTQIATTRLVEEKKTVAMTNEFLETALMETMLGESEYEVVL
ncbi:unnamed protein product [Peronospora destructor]|uniref:Uncharacterized protein n=1 Tax=Peronospora destructor TaxID=86335 RepID=A0AAV0TD14_9STRA|nr:unnamed protein product [Peronospora destructor]